MSKQFITIEHAYDFKVETIIDTCSAHHVYGAVSVADLRVGETMERRLAVELMISRHTARLKHIHDVAVAMSAESVAARSIDTPL